MFLNLSNVVVRDIFSWGVLIIFSWVINFFNFLRYSVLSSGLSIFPIKSINNSSCSSCFERTFIDFVLQQVSPHPKVMSGDEESSELVEEDDESVLIN